MSDKHPVIIHSLERKWKHGDFLSHTLVLTDPDFYEELDDCDWASSGFQVGVEESDNGSLPDGPGLWTAEFRVTDDKELEVNDVYRLVQESPWRPLTDKEAVLFAQGLPIEEVIVVEDRQLELNFPTEEAKEPTDE
jgi:hypothetical protein